MGASETARRTIIRDCKYRPIARLIQHDRAKAAVSRFIIDPMCDMDWLSEQAFDLREAIADDDFDRSVLDNNADYIDRYVEIGNAVDLPNVQYATTQPPAAISLNGTHVSSDIRFRLSRVTKTNKVRIGAGTLRYAKGKKLNAEVGLWQSAFMFGFLGSTNDPDEAAAEEKLCLTIDAFTGVAHPAPSDSTRRFNNMSAACASIAERWPNVPPPDGAEL